MHSALICSTDLHAQFGQFGNLLNGKSRSKSVAHVNLKQAGDSKSVVQAQEYKFLAKRHDEEILIGNTMAVYKNSPRHQITLYQSILEIWSKQT